MKSFSILTAVYLLFLIVSGAVQGAHITSLYNTGVDPSGNPRNDGEIGDFHYKLLITPDGANQTEILTSAGGSPIGPWLGDDILSAWISPNNADAPAGLYAYRTTFDLTGFNTATAVLSGQWATDNIGMDIMLNGVSTGNMIGYGTSPNYSYTDWKHFKITSNFKSGANTLDFLVFNGNGFTDTHGPTGLRTEMNLTANSVNPEPASLAIWGGIGIAGLVAGWRRQRSLTAQAITA